MKRILIPILLAGLVLSACGAKQPAASSAAASGAASSTPAASTPAASAPAASTPAGSAAAEPAPAEPIAREPITGEVTDDMDTPVLHWSVQCLDRTGVAGIDRYYDDLYAGLSRDLETAWVETAEDDREAMQDAFVQHGYEQTCQVTRSDERLYSADRESSIYTGGAHGFCVTECETFSVETGELLTLADLFPEEARAQILSYIEGKIDENPNAFYEEAKDLVAQTMGEVMFYLTPDSVVICFQQYDIACYAAGPQRFELPLSTFGDSLPAAYFG